MLNQEGMLENGEKVNLTVVPMSGWTRDMSFNETGMPWVLPSPHIPSAETALYYPASGIFGELGYISIGVGYTMPFKLFCADWINAELLSKRMNDLKLPGIKFRPIHIKPFYAVGKDTNIQGIEAYITDVNVAPLSLLQFYVMQELAIIDPEHKVFEHADTKRFNMFDKVCGSKEIRRRFCQRYQVADIIDYWNKDVDNFKAVSSRYYLYK
jgi:uncharacterized protein YbbC (DUF1343 family)